MSHPQPTNSLLLKIGPLTQFADQAMLQASWTTYAFPFFIIEATLWGVYAVLTVISVFRYMRRGKRPVFKRWSMYLSMVMFVLATAHLGINIWRVYMGEKRSHDWQIDISRCLGRLVGSDELPLACEGTALGTVTYADNVTTWFAPVLPLVNAAISDVIVTWRACMLWQGQRVVYRLSALLFLGTFAALVYGGSIGSVNGESPGLPGSVLSWVTNLWSTSLISWKAWQHRRVMKDALGSDMAHTKAERVLLLFIETGLLYAMMWTWIMVTNCIFVAGRSGGEFASSSAARIITFFDGIVYFSFIQLVSIYPMATVLLAEYTDSYYERAVAIETIRFTHGSTELRRRTAPDILEMATTPAEEGVTAFGVLSASDTNEREILLEGRIYSTSVGLRSTITPTDCA